MQRTWKSTQARSQALQAQALGREALVIGVTFLAIIGGYLLMK